MSSSQIPAHWRLRGTLYYIEPEKTRENATSEDSATVAELTEFCISSPPSPTTCGSVASPLLAWMPPVNHIKLLKPYATDGSVAMNFHLFSAMPGLT